MENMKNQHFFILCIFFSLFTIMFISCSSGNYLSECDEVIKSDSTQYYVSGLMDHTELKKGWIKEEVNQDSVSNWLQEYIHKNTSYLTYLDTIELNKIRKQEYDAYFKKWQKIKDEILNQDKVFYYSTPENYWVTLAGQDGLLVIRDCKILFVLILSQS